MSCGCDWEGEEYCLTLSSELRRCAKERACEECHRPIRVGEQYQYTVLKQDGSVYGYSQCGRCVRVAHCHFKARRAAEHHGGGVVIGELRCAVACLVKDAPGYREAFRAAWEASA